MDELDRLTEQISTRLFIELEASARHVHLTQEQALTLFGHGLTEQRPLSQPGQYLACERVSVLGPRGKLDGVAVLGPCRREAQVELSLTDGRALGLTLPIRLSGHVENTPGVTLVGSNGTVTLERGAIAAQRHIHMKPQDAALHRVRDGDEVRLRTLTDRPVVFEKVPVRVSPDFQTYAHLDFDEANACGMKRGDLGMLLP